MNLRGEIRRVVELPVEGRNGDDALAVLYRLVDELVAASESTILGVGVGTPGVVDTETGTIRWAVNLDWQDLPLGRLLRERYALPTSIANDSRAAALGEYLFTREGRVENLIAIKVGDGIGAGIVLSGSQVTATVVEIMSPQSTTAGSAAADGSAASRPLPGRAAS